MECGGLRLLQLPYINYDFPEESKVLGFGCNSPRKSMNNRSISSRRTLTPLQARFWQR
jgi:hypothetical protein